MDRDYTCVWNQYGASRLVLASARHSRLADVIWTEYDGQSGEEYAGRITVAMLDGETPQRTAERCAPVQPRYRSTIIGRPFLHTSLPPGWPGPLEPWSWANVDPSDEIWV